MSHTTKMVFYLRGAVKPYVRMAQRGKYIRPQAQEYLASKRALGWQMKATMSQRGWEMFPKVSLSVACVFFSKRGLHGRDLDNEIKAVLDAANGIVYPDDRWVDALSYSPRFLKRDLAENITMFTVCALDQNLVARAQVRLWGLVPLAYRQLDTIGL